MDHDRLQGLLYTAVLPDVMDGLGRMGQAMRPFVRTVDETLVMMGRARTGLYAPTPAAAWRSGRGTSSSATWTAWW